MVGDRTMEAHKYEIALVAMASLVSLVGGFVAKSIQTKPVSVDTPIDDHSIEVQQEPLVRYQGTETELKNDARW